MVIGNTDNSSYLSLLAREFCFSQNGTQYSFRYVIRVTKLNSTVSSRLHATLANGGSGMSASWLSLSD